MRPLAADQALRLHRRILERFWGDPGLRDRGLAELTVRIVAGELSAVELAAELEGAIGRI